MNWLGNKKQTNIASLLSAFIHIIKVSSYSFMMWINKQIKVQFYRLIQTNK